MKIHFFSALVLSLLSTTLSAQTKKIAFESHSGSREHFDIAITNSEFDGEESDFGLPPSKDIKTYKLDSVIFVSDTLAVVVKNEYSRLFSQPKDSAKFVRMVKDSVYNSELFARKHSLDSIKRVLKKDPYYINSNSINKVTFVGYDNNQKPPDKKQQLAPPVINDDGPDNRSPVDRELVLMLGTILLLSLLGGWVTWRFYQPRLQ